MSPAAGRPTRSKTNRQSQGPTKCTDNTSATTPSPNSKSQTSMSDIQRWDRDSGEFLWRKPEPPRSPQKRDTRSLLWNNSGRISKKAETKTRTLNRRRAGRRPPCSSSRSRGRNNGDVFTRKNGPSEEDTSSLTVPLNGQSSSGDPISRPRSETAGRDDETTKIDAIRAFLAPFDANNELGDWVFDKEKGRWWRDNKTANTIIWAPTADEFS